MSSLFERLYKNKQSERGRNQKENFLTEIFAYCLRSDLNFRNKFLKFIGCIEDCQDFDCVTQFSHNEFGRPDILIKIDNHTMIIIECKVDSTQSETQLNRYAKFLKSEKADSKRLIFLTKFFEKTTEFINDPDFKHIRWYEIYELIKDSSNEVSKELSNYLIEQKMNINMIPFTNIDISAITYINDTITKMDGVLIRLEDILRLYTNNKIRKDKINDLNTLGQYGIITNFGEGTLWLGFYQYDHNEIQFGIDLTTPIISLNRKKIDTVLELEKWKRYDNEDHTRTWYNAEKLSFFIADDVFYQKEAFDFIEKELKKIKKWQ